MPKTEAKLEDYKVLATIGTGNFGVCRKVKRKSDRKVFVWKEIDYGGMSEREKQLLVQEVNLLRELRHNHIVRYHDRIISKEESTLYIVMEYCEGGDLAALIAKSRQEKKLLEEDFVWRVFHQLLLALQECHRQRQGVHKVLHRDLKPANVFLDGLGQVKLGDFGLARILHHNFSLARTFVGTPYYMSPEQLQEQSYDEKSDLWSLGCLLYELCTLAPPFTAPNQKILSTKIRAGYFKRIPQLYSEDLHVCIASLLQTEPVMRPDIPSLLEKVEPHIMPTPKAPSHLSDLSTKEGRLQQKQKELLKKDVELKEKEATLSKWERQLAAWERALQERERQLKRRYNKVRPVKE